MSVTSECQRPMIGAMFRGPGPAKYYLPGTVGHAVHDFRKHRKPAYSFGTKSKMSEQVGTPGPGKYLVPASQTRYGKDGTAAYTLHDRTSLTNAFKTPAPGAYAPEKQRVAKHRYAPSYSFGLRTPYHGRDSVPGPNAYQLSTLIGPDVVGKISRPSYSMTGRSKIGSFHEDLQQTPGPGAYNTPNPNNYRNKKPSYSVYGRNFVPGDTTLKPGPGAYSPEKVYVTKKIAPKFSFGIRHSEYLAPLIFDPID